MKQTVRQQVKTEAARFTLMFAMVLAACGGDDSDANGAPMCVQIDPQSCTAAFPATWTDIHKNVIVQSCGVVGTGASCHGPDGKQGGLVLTPQAQAYDELTKGSNGHGARVIPMDPACSVLVERLETDNSKRWMPFGAPQRLSAAERCAVEQWIAQGAKP